jgi:hypothetical protein
VAHCLSQRDELAFICRETSVSCRHGPTEESHEGAFLVQHRPHAGAGRIALHHEWVGEVRQLDHQCRGEGVFECRERLRRRLGPDEALLRQELGERGRQGAVPLDEALVIPDQD